ncbi:adenylate/guanylate cyclase domain-containing protein [Bradyrhizobium mercantei]|uniref:adenylate/guanylate cyclase domain-containing protein n=1 Tax=Bradyrhizobium mercantei TaxID=1904807 RepID=UPI00097782D4|nr:adenylate/guanylate cyclase domain-containing protein [Bradyrhizobium mercantei]
MIVRDRFRGLFPKYFLALFLAVALPLAINGAIEAWFGYRDQRARLDQLLGVQATSAAAEIHNFISDIASQLGWLVQLPWTDEADDGRRTDALRLFRQAPAIVSLTLIDNNGLERLHVSRFGLNRIESRTDRSADPALVGAHAGRVWFSDVSYNRGSEPYLTVAIVGNRPAVGAAIAEVNLKLIWDVVSAITVGETGLAFVLDRQGRLIAHPDISLVLRGVEETTSRPFRAIRDAIGPGEGFATSRDAQGRPVAASEAPVAGPDWTVVVAQPLSEAYAPIYAALQRTTVLLAGSTIFAGLLAYAFAHRMTEPIRLLEEGTERIGAGSFEHRISIQTGDEFQRLANSFNRMAGELAVAQQHQERITKLKRFLAPQVADLVDRAGDDSVLDGRRTDVVVVFCDLRGFTAFSAGVAPEDVMSVLSGYYEVLGRVIAQFEATLISFSGDGLMVLVNAPVPVEEPALRAVDLAVEMQKRVQGLITNWRSQGYQVGFGIGLASGPATVGRIGYDDRLDYTAIGSVVNLAARLCASAADREILIDTDTATSVRGKRLIEDLGSRQIKGFDEAIPVFGISHDAL